MEKLKMIVTAVVVLTVVGSAFAFKAKVGRFCVAAPNSGNDNCTTVTLPNARTTTNSPVEFKYYPSFDGDKTACTAAGNALCTATVKVTTD